MKKLFLFSLMALCTCVMAFAAEVSTFAELKAALSASGSDEVVTLANDITYEGSAVLDIQRSLTLDGAGHKIIGFAKTAINADGKSQKHNTSIAINASKFGSTAELDVTIKNLSVGNPSEDARYYGIAVFDGVKKLSLDNVKIETGTYGAQQTLCFTGTQATPINLTMNNCYLNSGKSAYSVYILKPVVGTVSNSTIEGWCGLYFKYRMTGVYGSVVGSRGSNITCENCNFVCPNIHYGASNGFAIFPFEDDGITLKLVNCGLNKDQLSDQWQGVFSIQYRTRTEGFQPINIEVSGDNTYVLNATLNDGADAFVKVNDNWWNGANAAAQATSIDIDDTPITIAFKGGTYSVNPDLAYFTDGKGGQKKVTIPEGYEVKAIETQQGDETTILYRVREKIVTPTSTDINDNLQGKGDGQNDETNFKIASNQTVEEESVVANYIEVSNDATLTVPQGKELVVTSGLDVTDGAQLVVEAGSTLVVGEGGVTSENAESIVITADENGSASFLLDPKVIVNTTPNLTVKMTAKGVGYETFEGEDYYHWFRFAAPVANIAGFSKNKDYGTYIYKWDYAANDWGSISALSDMKPFNGYSLTTEHNGTEDVEYSFKGQLAGNQDMKLEFNSRGYNYFGNSYTGYIDVHALVAQLMENENIDGSIYLWNNENQGFYPVTLGDITSDPVEVAPMQTFILRQINTGEAVSTNIIYASAIWGNPRYGKVSTPAVVGAPARYAKANNVSRMNIVVTAANGKKDNITLKEADQYSNDFEKGFDALKYMNERTVNLYTTIDGENYGIVATDNLEGMKLSFQTVNEIAYTLSFNNINDTEYALRDNVTGKVIAIEEGTTYDFAAQPNSTVEGRFEIVKAAKVTTAIENTEVKANVKGIYTITGQYLGENFDVLPAGVYVVDGVKIVK